MSVNNPTPKQKLAVDNILSGRFKTKTAALQDAGYSDRVSRRPAETLGRARGVQIYLKTLDERSRKKFTMDIREKMMDVYFEGISATKLVRGSRSRYKEWPDWMARKAFVDRLAEFVGWLQPAAPPSGHTQYNFFMVDEAKRAEFNEKFKSFIQQINAGK